MAKTVGDLLIKLGVEGIEGVTALKSSLKGLSASLGPTDKNIRKIRTEILEFANAGKQSKQAIRGVIESFKGLQAQASINSTVYKQLAADIEGLESSLEAIKPDAEKAAQALERLKQVNIPSKAPGDFAKNMEFRRQQLQGLKADSEEYLNTLVGIKNFEAQQAARVARQEIVAQARAARTGLPKTIFNMDQPATLAALRLRIGEVQNEIENLEVTSKEYRDANVELIALQKGLSDALDGTAASFDRLGRQQETAARRAQKLAGIQAAQAGQAGARNPRTGTPMAARDPNSGVMIAGGSAFAEIPTPPPELSSLYKGISQIKTASVDATLDRMGKSYQSVARDIKDATLASNGSINSLQAQRASWASLRAGLHPASKAYQDVGREIEKVDQRLEKLNRRRRRPTLGGTAQVLGGIAAGGIFGGPEGAIGGALGAPFGPGGVAAGAALGAQAKMLREALSSASDYASQVKKLEIALEGAAGVEFPQAMKAAADVTKEFNVPQEAATRGMTRLTAAVVGAGGSVADAEIVFRNVTAAIKATGGGAQDVESAITAMVQTFSKGKVSAEEISGQLGERFPAAVTQFAKANDMTLPELQKAFKAGTVGLNELMKFVESLGPKYAKIARGIAASSADAGARSAVAFDNMRLQVGKALQPIGAQLQDAFVKFATDSLPVLIKSSQLAAAAMNALLNVGAFLIENFDKVAASALVLGAAIGTAGLTQAAITAGGAMNALRLALFNVKLAVAGLSKALAFLAANPIVLLVAGVTAAGVALYRAATAHDRFVKSIDDGNTTIAEAKTKTEELNEKINKLQSRLNSKSNGRLVQSIRRQLRNLYDDVDDLNNAMERAIYRDFGGGEGFQGPVVAGMRRVDELPPTQRTKFPSLEDLDDTGKGKRPMSETELAVRDRIRQAQLQENELLELRLSTFLKILRAEKDIEDTNERIDAQREAANQYILGERDIVKKAADEAKEAAEAKRKLDAELQKSLDDRRLALGMITQEEFNRLEIERERARLEEKGATKEQIAEQLEMMEKVLSQTPIDKFILKAKAELADLQTMAIGISQSIGNAVGNALQTGISGLIDGTKSAKEIFSDFLREISNILAQEGAKIIGTYIAIGIAKIFAGLAGGTKFGEAGNFETGTGLTGFAKPSGGDFTGLFAGRATGGPVESGQPYMVGERGPELFIPFQRGQVLSKQRTEEVAEAAFSSTSVTNNSFQQMQSTQLPFTKTTESASQESMRQPLNIRYESTVVNGVEYVTAEQHRKGMAQAAERGRDLSIEALQNSVRTRRKVAI